MSAKRYTKDDIETHSAGYYAPYYPAVNIKAYHYPHCFKVANYLDISEDKAESLLTAIFENSQMNFWDNVPEYAKEIFGNHVKTYSAGRSGGWVIVCGLPEIESWDAIMLAKWRKFENMCKAERDYYCSWDFVKEELSYEMELENA